MVDRASDPRLPRPAAEPHPQDRFTIDWISPPDRALGDRPPPYPQPAQPQAPQPEKRPQPQRLPQLPSLTPPPGPSAEGIVVDGGPAGPPPRPAFRASVSVSAPPGAPPSQPSPPPPPPPRFPAPPAPPARPRPTGLSVTGPPASSVNSNYPPAAPHPQPPPSRPWSAPEAPPPSFQPAASQPTAPQPAPPQPAPPQPAPPQPAPPQPARPAESDVVETDADLLARIGLLTEQLDLALSELALRRAAYRQVRDDEGVASPWLTTELDLLVVPRVARALSAELAALERLRLWAQSLHALHRAAQARRIMPSSPPPAAAPRQPGSVS